MWYDSKVVKNMECENKRRFADGNAISEFNAKVQYFFYSTNFCSSFIVIYVFYFNLKFQLLLISKLLIIINFDFNEFSTI